MKIFDRYSELLEHVHSTGHKWRVLGCAPDGSPVVSVRAGGAKEPAIFISAGSHSTEHAGVSAAVALIDALVTEHKVYVIPTRDPIGLNGMRYALGLSLGEEPPLNSIEDLEALLRNQGEILFEDEDTLLALIGEYGYSTRGLYGRFEKGAEFLEPLKGRRIYFPSRAEGIEGTAPFQRAYTLIVTPDAEVLHINRFHDTPWAPVEPRCARRLMAEIQPGISFDIHEAQTIEDCYWLSARQQQDPETQSWEERMARETIQAIADAGGRLVNDEYSPGAFFTSSERSVFWLDASIRGEGLNLMDFASRKYGPAFGTEMGMYGSFEHRVTLGMLTVQTAVKVFEERYA